ncbi:MAG: DUF2382 domain-containing protein [Chloroflexota bacterium]|nr:DUF2382 domain-containing protein [Chloroflexota bacterium]
MHKPTGEQEHSIPRIEEQVTVDKHWIEAGHVQVTTRTVTDHEQVVEILRRQSVEVTHVPVAEYVDTMPQQRTEGNTLIVPVVEEEIVLQKRLYVREEIHITLTESTVPFEETVPLRRTEVVVERNQS